MGNREIFARRLTEALKLREKNAQWLHTVTGISKGTLSQYQKAQYAPKQDRLRLMAECLSVSEEWLAGGDCEMEKTAPQPAFRLPVLKRLYADRDSFFDDNIAGDESADPKYDGGGFVYAVADANQSPAVEPGDLALVRLFDKTERAESLAPGLYFAARAGEEWGGLFVVSMGVQGYELRYGYNRSAFIPYGDTGFRALGKVILTIKYWQ